MSVEYEGKMMSCGDGWRRSSTGQRVKRWLKNFEKRLRTKMKRNHESAYRVIK